MNVTVEDAYREACQALGEAIVAQRFLGRQIEELSQEATTEDVITTPVETNGARSSH